MIENGSDCYYLKEDEVDQEEEEAGLTKPEELVSWLDQWCALHNLPPLLNSETQLGDDHL